MRTMPAPNQKWRYKKNRGTGTFTVIRVVGMRVTLRDFFGKDKRIGLTTLYGDYEQVPNA